MTALPAALAPWAPWLGLFPADMAPAVGALLLRLDPLVGKLNTATLARGAEPEGLGNIGRRGHYEHLLLSQWAIADAEPDEFIRRAGSGELLFNGPEPAVHQRSLHSVALFDAGPAQLGAPRLAHLALFILLARRAQQAGAQFVWGTWQRPGVLHEDSGADALRRLLKSRTLQAAPDDACRHWEAALAARLGADVADCWLVGVGAAIDAPRQARDRVTIRRPLEGDHLDVALQQRRGYRVVQLHLPDAPTAVRLLRKPFAPDLPPGMLHHHGSRPSRAQPPRFASGGHLLCVPQLNGGAAVYQVSKSGHAKPGKFRLMPAPAHGAIIAAGVFKGNLSCVTTAAAATGHTLGFLHFPGPLFSSKAIVCDRPPPEHFQAPPGMARWLQAFYLRSRNQRKPAEHVVVLDTKRRLVAWQARPSTVGGRPTLSFQHMLNNVIGIHQAGDTLLIGCANGSELQLYEWASDKSSPVMTRPVERQASGLLVGVLRWKVTGHSGYLLAVKLGVTRWWVGSYNQGETMDVDDGAIVLGVAISEKHPQPGLVVLHPGRRRIELRVGPLRYELATSPEEIQQATMDGASARIAWITAKSGTVVVRDLDGAQPLLQVASDGGADA